MSELSSPRLPRSNPQIKSSLRLHIKKHESFYSCVSTKDHDSDQTKPPSRHVVCWIPFHTVPISFFFSLCIFFVSLHRVRCQGRLIGIMIDSCLEEENPLPPRCAFLLSESNYLSPALNLGYCLWMVKPNGKCQD